MIDVNAIFLELLNRFPEGKERVAVLMSLAERILAWGLPALTPKERLDVIYRILKSSRRD